MEWGVLLVTLLGLTLGGIVLQATMAARHWRRAIAGGDVDVLRQAVDQAFASWQRQKPPKGFPIADWQGLQSATVLAADGTRCRVSMLVGPDIRVVGNRRQQTGTALDVARRVAVKMIERVLYEIPHVRFDEVQVDVHTSYQQPDGTTPTECILTTRVGRDEAAAASWDTADDAELLLGWTTIDQSTRTPVDPDEDPLIVAEAQAAVAEAEATLRKGPK
jgi:hypothetical protein